MSGRASPRGAAIVCAFVAHAAATEGGALAQPAPAGATAAPAAKTLTVDETAVRFFASETGGPTRPRFISKRLLALEARLEMMGQQGTSPREPIDERSVRAAVEHHVAQELLANIPHELPPKPDELRRVRNELRESLEARVGGAAALAAAAELEGIDVTEVDEMVWREAAAALYIDRAVSPVLHPSDEQIREAYRIASHPYRNLRYEEARERVTRWIVLERVRVAEASFLQAGRSHVTIVFVAPMDAAR